MGGGESVKFEISEGGRVSSDDFLYGTMAIDKIREEGELSKTPKRGKRNYLAGGGLIGVS